MSWKDSRQRVRRRSSLLTAGEDDQPDEEDPHYLHFWNDIRLQLARLKASKRRQMGVSSDAVSRSTRNSTSKVRPPAHYSSSSSSFLTSPQEMRRRQLIDPDGRWKAGWNTLIAMLIAYTVAALPVQLAFDVGFSSEFAIVEFVISGIFFADILVNLNTVVKNTVTGTVEMDRRQIATEYSKLWLWIDVAATLPVDTIVAAAQPALNAQSLRVLRLLRFFRVLKLVRAQRVYSLSHSESTALVFVAILLIAHFLGCFWFYIGSSSSPAASADGLPASWIELAELNGFVEQGYSTGDYYVVSVYWAVTTMLTIGYGDIHPVNSS